MRENGLYAKYKLVVEALIWWKKKCEYCRAWSSINVHLWYWYLYIHHLIDNSIVTITIMTTVIIEFSNAEMFPPSSRDPASSPKPQLGQQIVKKYLTWLCSLCSLHNPSSLLCWLYSKFIIANFNRFVAKPYGEWTWTQETDTTSTWHGRPFKI